MLLFMEERVNQLYMLLTNVTGMEERVKQLYISLTNVTVYGGVCQPTLYVINQCYYIYMEERVKQLYMSVTNVTVCGRTC